MDILTVLCVLFGIFIIFGVFACFKITSTLKSFKKEREVSKPTLDMKINGLYSSINILKSVVSKLVTQVDSLEGLSEFSELNDALDMIREYDDSDELDISGNDGTAEMCKEGPFE